MYLFGLSLLEATIVKKKTNSVIMSADNNKAGLRERSNSKPDCFHPKTQKPKTKTQKPKTKTQKPKNKLRMRSRTRTRACSRTTTPLNFRENEK
jgi:hypothetical protein